MTHNTETLIALRKSIETIPVKYDADYPHFGLRGEPHYHKQHTNQQRGLDLYVHVVNFETGEWCHKKLYSNSKGIHFKHTGYSPMYLHLFTESAQVIPFQVKFEQPAGADIPEDVG